MGEDDLAFYEWSEEGKPYREWLIPAAIVNASDGTDCRGRGWASFAVSIGRTLGRISDRQGERPSCLLV
jgi:hypothetical protein